MYAAPQQQFGTMQMMAAPQVTYAQAPMQYVQAPVYETPMAAAQVGNTMVVGQDANFDGIPDVLETFVQPQVTYAQAPQMTYAQAPVQYAQAPQYTYAQPMPMAAAQVGN